MVDRIVRLAVRRSVPVRDAAKVEPVCWSAPVPGAPSPASLWAMVMVTLATDSIQSSSPSSGAREPPEPRREAGLEPPDVRLSRPLSAEPRPVSWAREEVGLKPGDRVTF